MSNFIYYEKLEDYEEQVRKAKECDEKDKEIERLNKECDTYMKIATKRGNIIDELERHLEQQWLEWKDCETDVRFMAIEDKCILEKLRELKGSDKDE